MVGPTEVLSPVLLLFLGRCSFFATSSSQFPVPEIRSICQLLSYPGHGNPSIPPIPPHSFPLSSFFFLVFFFLPLFLSFNPLPRNPSASKIFPFSLILFFAYLILFIIIIIFILLLRYNIIVLRGVSGKRERRMGDQDEGGRVQKKEGGERGEERKGENKRDKSKYLISITKIRFYLFNSSFRYVLLFYIHTHVLLLNDNKSYPSYHAYVKEYLSIYLVTLGQVKISLTFRLFFFWGVIY